ncbi:polysaccharide biosynthesis protein [Vreelandella sp. H-I2]
MSNDISILVTGGTRFFSHTLIYMLFERYKPKKFVIFSSGEMKQWELVKKFAGGSSVRFFIGYLVQAAATRITLMVEYNSFELIKTNISGVMNLVVASINKNVKKAVRGVRPGYDLPPKDLKVLLERKLKQDVGLHSPVSWQKVGL